MSPSSEGQKPRPAPDVSEPETTEREEDQVRPPTTPDAKPNQWTWRDEVIENLCSNHGYTGVDASIAFDGYKEVDTLYRAGETYEAVAQKIADSQ